MEVEASGHSSDDVIIIATAQLSAKESTGNETPMGRRLKKPAIGADSVQAACDCVFTAATMLTPLLATCVCFLPLPVRMGLGQIATSSMYKLQTDVLYTESVFGSAIVSFVLRTK